MGDAAILLQFFMVTSALLSSGWQRRRSPNPTEISRLGVDGGIDAGMGTVSRVRVDGTVDVTDDISALRINDTAAADIDAIGGIGIRINGTAVDCQRAAASGIRCAVRDAVERQDAA